MPIPYAGFCQRTIRLALEVVFVKFEDLFISLWYIAISYKAGFVRAVFIGLN